MKKKLCVLLTLVFIMIIMTACGKKDEKATNTDTSGTQASSTPAKDSTQEVSEDSQAEDSITKDSVSVKETDKVFKIGISQLVEHDALDAAYQGFVDGLEEAGYVNNENIVLNFNNAQGDQSNCTTIANKLVNENCDLILSIATSAAQAAANATEDIPILITAVTDPVEAGLVDSIEAPGGNVTGTSDMNPVAEQIDLLYDLVPTAKTIAVLYCSSEVNSEIQASLAIEAAEALGLEVKKATVSNSNEIQQVVQDLVGKVDAIYAPTDNLIANNMPTVAMITTPNKIPVICGEANMVLKGGLATRGLNYYNLGKQTAAQAVKILEGSAVPAQMPIEYLKEFEFTYNEEVAEELGIEIPEDYK